jgi:hypothetical protein
MQLTLASRIAITSAIIEQARDILSSAKLLKRLMEQESVLAGRPGAAFDRAPTRHYRTATVDHQALIFLHIPKTAGTTLNRIIEWQYSALSIFTVDPHGIRATPERFKTLSEERRRQLRVVRKLISKGNYRTRDEDDYPAKCRSRGHSAQASAD